MNRTMLGRPGVSKAACLAVAGLLIVACYGFVETTNACMAAEAQCGGDQPPDAKQVQNPEVRKANQPVGTGDSGRAKGDRPKPVIRRAPGPGDVKALPKSRQAAVPKVATEPPWPGWACKENPLTLEPIWAGQPLSATWVIQNGGEGDLVIKIKGG